MNTLITTLIIIVIIVGVVMGFSLYLTASSNQRLANDEVLIASLASSTAATNEADASFDIYWNQKFSDEINLDYSSTQEDIAEEAIFQKYLLALNLGTSTATSTQ